MHLSGHSELSPDKILFCVKKATEKVSEMQQIVEKALKEDEKLRKKGIIPRLSTDIFDEPFDFDEIQSIVNEMETTNQNVKTESSETTTVKTEINDTSNETQQMTEPILIEDDVKLEEVLILIIFRLISILRVVQTQVIYLMPDRLQHKTTPNNEFLDRFKIYWRWRHSNSESFYVGSYSFRH